MNTKSTHKHPTQVERKGPPLIEMKDISIAFGGIKAVDHASVDLYPGEVVGLLGHNGAGKSRSSRALTSAIMARFSSMAIGLTSTTRAMPRRSGSRRSTRRSPWPIMSMPLQISILAVSFAPGSARWTTLQWKPNAAR
jgi:ABC-type phosphonate transport system ATPase subunit